MIQATSQSDLQHSGQTVVQSAGDAATVAIARQCLRASTCPVPKSTRPKSCHGGPLFTDFFRALVFRPCVRPCSSAAFDRAVLAGQIAALLLVLAALMPIVKPMITPAPSEIAVIETWMENQYVGPVQIRNYGTPQPNPNGPGIALRVSYRYQTTSRKSISTNQWFLIQNNQVTSVDSEL